ncbi:MULTISPECIES: hypothetical protein [Streptomyces]|uniref:hypothetical protein n=1 Tax=Streptomyces TaxID=1883 RepID=UPI000A51D850|nr:MULTISPECIES: hypothetical protein [Streptomyces]MBX9427451.1 hypothetical protein [Streptomyces lateritius]
MVEDSGERRVSNNGRYVEMNTALAGATTRLGIPFPFDIDPAGLLLALDPSR